MSRVLVLAVLGLLAAASSGEASAAPWCGSVSEADRAPAVAGHPIRVLYAFPTDGVDRAEELAPRLAADIEEIEAWWQREDPSRKPRFDQTAFACGVQPDLGKYRLPRTAGELTSSDATWSLLLETLQTWPLASLTKFVVYYDGPADARLCGRGGGVAGGGAFGIAVVFLAACPNVSTASTAAHELLHSLGAVPRSGAVNTCPASPGHVCDSTGDLMYPNAQYAPLSSFQLDVGRNDYYGHSGAWQDVQDSPWLHRTDASATLDLRLQGPGRVVSNVPGVDCTASCSTAWSPGAVVSLEATPAAGRVFAGWRGVCTGTRSCDAVLDASKTVTAAFAPARFRVNVKVAGRGRVTSAPQGIACPGRCAASLPSFEVALLQAKPAKGWRLRGWSGDCRGRARTCFVSVNRASTARATFVKIR
jgi:hypothetical protein